VRALVATAGGTFAVDLETEEAQETEEELEPSEAPVVGLPRLVAAAGAGSTLVAVVAARPPLLVSHDGGRTWRQAGHGLPAGFAAAVSREHPDVIVFAARNRLYLSRDGGRFWRALRPELPDIEALALG
jgi:hypothetical protein